MKKIITIVVIAFISISVKAQLTNTKWKGTLQLDSPTEVIMDFKTDTLQAITTSDNMPIETMRFSVKDNILSLWKITGQSDCATDTECKYKFEIKEGNLTLILVEDDCDDRSSVMDESVWKME